MRQDLSKEESPILDEKLLDGRNRIVEFFTSIFLMSARPFIVFTIILMLLVLGSLINLDVSLKKISLDLVNELGSDTFSVDELWLYFLQFTSISLEELSFFGDWFIKKWQMWSFFKDL